MKRKITCEVVYPVQFQIEIDDSLDELLIKEIIKNRADELFESSSIKPIIHSCSDKRFIE